MLHILAHACPRTDARRIASRLCLVDVSLAVAAAESPLDKGRVIKQQDNDGDLRGPTANGLTHRFLRG